MKLSAQANAVTFEGFIYHMLASTEGDVQEQLFATMIGANEYSKLARRLEKVRHVSLTQYVKCVPPFRRSNRGNSCLVGSVMHSTVKVWFHLPEGSWVGSILGPIK